METEQKGIQPEQSPVVEHPVFNDKNHRKLLLGILLIAILAFGSYKVASFYIASNFYDSSYTPDVTDSYGYEPVDVVDTNTSEDVATLQILDLERILNARVDFDSPSDSFGLEPPSQQLKLTEGKTSFLYCDMKDLKEGVCNTDSPGHNVKAGILTVSHITPGLLNPPFPDRWDDTSVTGLLVMTFALADGRTESSVGVFDYTNANVSTNIYGEDIDTLRIELTQSIDDRFSVEAVRPTKDHEVEVVLKDASGKTTTQSYVLFYQKYGSSFIALTGDKQNKIDIDHELGYQIEYPREFMLYGGSNQRALEVETSQNTSPVYFAEACGLEPTLAEGGGTFYLDSEMNGVSERVLVGTLSVHKITKPQVALTTSYYGYDPADWGKVMGYVTLKDYTNAINTGAQIPGRTVTTQQINGITVRHIASFDSPRPCDGNRAEQYQWIVGDHLFNIILEDPKENPIDQKIKTKLFQSVFSSLKLI